MRYFARLVLCGTLMGSVASCTSGSDLSPSAKPAGGSPSATATPRATPTLAPALVHMLTVIHAKGYQTFPSLLKSAGEFSPSLRPVIVAERRYLGNGIRCANVFFFARGRYVGRDSSSCRLYPEIAWGNGDEIAVTYPRYGKNDALCCPTLDPELVIYRLVDGHIKRVD